MSRASKAGKDGLYVVNGAVVADTVLLVNQDAPKRRKPRQIEAGLQEQIVRFLRVAAPQCVVLSIPNGAACGGRNAKTLLRTGMLPGAPDLCIVVPGGKAHFVEVKQGRGKLNEKQEEVRFLMVRRAIPHAVCKSLDDVRLALAAWGIGSREVSQ